MGLAHLPSSPYAPTIHAQLPPTAPALPFPTDDPLVPRGIPIGYPGYPDQIPLEPDRLEHLMYDQNAFLYAVTAMLCLLIYEYLITFNMEVKYIWKSRPIISLANALFFFNRYFPILRSSLYLAFSLRPARSTAGCNRGTDFNSWSTMANVATVEILMLFRAWVLWDKSRLVGGILAGGLIAALCVSIAIVKSDLKPIPGVIALPPTWFLPCDRPSPYKYFVEYLMAFFVEVMSFSFMMGRITYLASRSKNANPERARANTAWRILRALRRHGAYYFAAVIFVMGFTILSSFVQPLSRTIIVGGFAPTITSIACNRVIFALRGLYLEIGVGGGYSTDTNTGKANQGRTSTTTRRYDQHGRSRIAYGIGEIAETRHDLPSRDIETNENYKECGSGDEREDDVEKAAHFRTRNLPAPIQLRSQTDRRRSRLGTPYHAHATSSTTALNSKDSSGTGKGTASIEEKPPPSVLRAVSFSHNARSPSASSSRFGYRPSVASTQGMSSKAHSPERRSPPSAMHPLPEGTERYPSVSDTAVESPTGETDAGGSFRGRFGTSWWKRKHGRRESSLSYGEMDQGDTSNDSKTRTRGKERHPLDHHYEMDTIHSQMVPEWDLSELEDEDFDSSRPWRDATR